MELAFQLGLEGEIEFCLLEKEEKDNSNRGSNMQRHGRMKRYIFKDWQTVT